MPESYELKEALNKAMVDLVKPDGDPIRMVVVRALLYIVQTLDRLESQLDTLDHSVAALNQ